MRTYTVHRPRRAAGNPGLEAEQIVFIKEGFSWPALFIPFLWFIYHRMWLVLTGYAVAMVGLGVLSSVLEFGSAIDTGLSILIQVVLAAEANDLRRWTLTRARYEFVDVVQGPNLYDAETAYFTIWAAEVAAADKQEAETEALIDFRIDQPAPATPA